MATAQPDGPLTEELKRLLDQAFDDADEPEQRETQPSAPSHNAGQQEAPQGQHNIPPSLAKISHAIATALGEENYAKTTQLILSLPFLRILAAKEGAIATWAQSILTFGRP